MSRIAVVGGGIGGLVCAARLAHAGHSVHLFEQADSVGGKMGTAAFDGCRFDTGPSLLTMPFVLEDFFASVGRKFSDYVTLVPVQPACRYTWSDGLTLDVPNITGAAPEAYEDAFGVFGTHNARAVVAYLHQAKAAYEATREVFLFKDFRGLREFFSITNAPLLRFLPQLGFATSLHRHHAQMFTDRRLVQLFDRFATYNGSSPYLAPATLKIIPWVEFGMGAWYPLGGMHTLAEAIAAVAQECGVHIHTGTSVRNISTQGNSVQGVVLDTGERIAADHVVSNADVFTTRHNLLGKRVPWPKRPSSAGFVLLASVQGRHPELAHHNVLFGDDYRREFDDIFGRRVAPHDMTVYVAQSVATDATQAPADRSNWFVLVNVPAEGHGEGTWTETVSADYASRVLRRIEHFGIGVNVRLLRIRTPADMAGEWRAPGGSLYGQSSNSMFGAFLRQRPRSREYRNLWYVGGSVHPGGGIPLVTLSGMTTSRLILQQES